jgi:serine/threonine protein kinase
MESKRVIAAAKQYLPELAHLPAGWEIQIVPGEEKRIAFVKAGQEATYTHPSLGPLPPPWILKLKANEKERSLTPTYYNRQTQETTTKDPRHSAKTLSLRKKMAPAGLEIAASIVKNKNYDLSQWKRQEISTSRSLRDKFEIVHTIDDGEGQIGGMNGGVFVVRMKRCPDKLYIEKRFKDGDVEGLGEIEIKMLRSLTHHSLTAYHAAFITPDLRSASVSVEFCDRGSLEDLMKAYKKKGVGGGDPRVPEGFVWHAFVGLCDGLAFLQGGKSFLRQSDKNRRPGWIPILHRDVKPDNVLLRSRSQIGSTKYFYCILSDFGLACEDYRDDHPKVNPHQKARVKLGTSVYYAPELLWNPYPGGCPSRPNNDPDERRYFPGKNTHSKYSDLWALGACIYNLCMVNTTGSTMSHIDWEACNKYPKNCPIVEGTESRIKELNIPKELNYSRELRGAVREATKWNISKRPSPITMIDHLEVFMKGSGFETQGGKSEALPDWCTKVHQYQYTAEQLSKNKPSAR